MKNSAKIIMAFLTLAFTSPGAYAMNLNSSAFKQNAAIPSTYTCDGEDISPELSWSDAPAGTKSFALISDDPDAPGGDWVHWILYDIPSTATGLKKNIPKTETLNDGAKQGVTNFGRVGYGGPCPPPGRPHRYYFKLYALDQMLGLPPKATKSALLKSMDGHILAQAELMGRYGREK